MLSKVRDVLVLWVLCLVAVTAGYQGASYADDPSNGTPRLVVNYCKVKFDRWTRINGKMVNNNPTEASGMVIGDGDVTCPRNHTNKKHDRILTSVTIEKRHNKGPHWMRYRVYAYTEKWGSRSETVYPLAHVKCDGAGLYRVKVKVWTKQSGVNPSVYPSNLVTKTSTPRSMCHKSTRIPLTDVNR